MKPDIETPPGPFEAMPDRTTTVVVGMILADVLLWVALLRGYVPMPGMGWLMEAGIPMTAPGAPELAVFQVGTLSAFLGYTFMWGVMMWAMMFPAMTRFTRDYARAQQGTLFEVVATVMAFIVGYCLVWMATAVIPLSMHVLLPGGIYGFTKAYTHLAIGGGLLLTGVYQMSEFKQERLRDCCSRILSTQADPLEGIKEGLSHGVDCVLVCFGVFFVVMVAFGEMNAFWMAALTFPIAAERLPETWGEELADAFGVAALLAGLYVLLLRPDLPIAFVA